MSSYLILQDQKLYYLSFNGSCQLGFCIESKFELNHDTLKTEKLGSYILKNKRLFFLLNDEKNKTDFYKLINQGNNKQFHCFQIYDIRIESDRIIIPDRLF